MSTQCKVLALALVLNEEMAEPHRKRERLVSMVFAPPLYTVIGQLGKK